MDISPDEMLNHPLLNRGSAFNQEERDRFRLNGFLPYHISTIEEQVKRRYDNFKKQPTDLARYLFLNALHNRNETLFYRLVYEHIEEMLPLIYTPTVGDVSKYFSALYAEPRGLFLSYPLKHRMAEMIAAIPRKEIDIIVVTDGERILGLGDLGVGGMAIPVGKLALYTLFGGIHPARTLPIQLDVGTNNPDLLHDPLYLGWHHNRIAGQEYDDFVDHFVREITKRYPKALLQWEDFAKQNAGPLLDRYRDKICSFNDDIQGTAAVTLAALFTAVKLSKTALKDQRIVLFGAGSAGLGIANQIVRGLQEEGISEKEAYQHIYAVDRFGLIHTGQSTVEPSQQRFARKKEEIEKWKVDDPNKITLADVARHVHPTILIGVSAQPNVFTEEVVREMTKSTKRPIIFPLSNPNSQSEAHPADLMRWTNGQAIVATGSPYGEISYDGKKCHIPQCNNVYVFPGLGLGVIASRATRVSDRMILKASQTLSEHSPALKNPDAGLFPRFPDLRNVCRAIAFAVGKMAQAENLAPTISDEQLMKRIDEEMWYPAYDNKAFKAFS